MVRSVYDPVIRVRKDVIRAVLRQSRDPRPVADVWSDIETLIEEYGNERAQDAIAEFVSNDDE
jgi:hypothetical protein